MAVGHDTNSRSIGIVDDFVVPVPKNERRSSGAVLYRAEEAQLRAFFYMAFSAALDYGVGI